MASIQRKEQLRNFLQRFDQSPILFPDNINDLGRMGQFLLAYLGNCFIEGYRLVEKIGHNMFLLSLMNISQARKKIGESISEFKLVCVEFEEKNMEDRSVRAEKYKEINEIIKFFCQDGSEKHVQGIDIIFVFAKTFMVSKQLTLETLQKNSSLSLKNFYNRDYKISKKSENHHGLKLLSQVEQGKRLHELVEMYIKGSASICNQKYVAKSVFHHSKFGYNVQKVINTVCLIIGKEIIQGGFVSMSSEKWMRKFSEKKFKKFDLLLRNEKKVCIIDWKFSRLSADQKINTQQFTIKNKQYFQLARKQYNAEVQLRFYCFNQNFSNHYHQYSFANYHYDIDKVEINDHEYFTNECNQIQISDSDDDEKKVQKQPQNQKTPTKNKNVKKYEEDQNGSSDEYCDVILNSNKGAFEWKSKSRQQIQSQHIPHKFSNQFNESKGIKELGTNQKTQVYLKENKKTNIIDLNNDEEFKSFSNSLEIISQNCPNIISIEDEPNIKTKYDKSKQANEQHKEKQMQQQMSISETEQKTIIKKHKKIENQKEVSSGVQQVIQHQQGQIIEIQEETPKRNGEMRTGERIGEIEQVNIDSSQKQINNASVQSRQIPSLTQTLKIKPFQVLLTHQQPPITHNQHSTNQQRITQPITSHVINFQNNTNDLSAISAKDSSIISFNQKHSKQNEKKSSTLDNNKDEKLKNKQKDSSNIKIKPNQDSSVRKQAQNHLIQIQNRSYTKHNCNQEIFINSSSEQIKQNRNKNDSLRNINSEISIGRSIKTLQSMEIQIATDLKKEREKIERKVREIQIRRQTTKEEIEVERPKYKSRTILYVDSSAKHNSFIRPQERMIKGKRNKSVIDLEDDDCVVVD